MPGPGALHRRRRRASPKLARDRAQDVDDARRQPRALLRRPRRVRQRAPGARPRDPRRGARVRRQRDQRVRCRPRARRSTASARMLGRRASTARPSTRSTESANALGAVVDERDGRVDVGDDDELAAGALRSRPNGSRPPTPKLGKADRRRAQAHRAARARPARGVAPARGAAARRRRVGRTVGSSRRLRIAPVVGRRHARRPCCSTQRPGHRGVGNPRRQAAVAFTRASTRRRRTWGDGDEDDEPETGRGYAPLQTPSSFDWREQGMLYVGNDLPDPRRAAEPWLEQAGDRLCELVERGGRACARAVHVARQRRAVRRTAARAHGARRARAGRRRRRPAHPFVRRRRVVGARRHPFVLGRHRRARRLVRARRDRPHPVPVARRPVARGAPSARRSAAGSNAFAAVDLPAAALVLAQGAGRLIRRRDDRGVVARSSTRGSRRRPTGAAARAMPPFSRSIDLDEACAFLRDATAVPSSVPAGAPIPDLVEVRRTRSRAPVRRRRGGPLPRRQRLHDGVPARRTRRAREADGPGVGCARLCGPREDKRTVRAHDDRPCAAAVGSHAALPLARRSHVQQRARRGVRRASTGSSRCTTSTTSARPSRAPVTDADVAALDAVIAETNQLSDELRVDPRVPLRAHHDRQPQRPRRRAQHRAADAHRAARAVDEAPRLVARGARRRRLRRAQQHRGRARVRAAQGGRGRRAADGRARGVAGGRARGVGFARVAAAARRRVVAADGRRATATPTADGRRARARDAPRRRRRARPRTKASSRRGRRSRCRSRPRSTAPRARPACSTGGAASTTTSSPRCATTTSTAPRSTR